MICGIIDFGSNTIRLSVYEYKMGTIKMMLSKKSIAGILGYAEAGVLSSKGIYKACGVLNYFKDILQNFGIENTYVFATASLRNISNTEEVVRLIKENTGFDIDLLSGEDEALLDFYGAARATDIESGLLVDIGGGSTELVAYENRIVKRAVSLPLGSLNLSLKYVNAILPKKSNMQKMKDDLKEELAKIDLSVPKQGMICGVGGTVRAARKLYNELYGLPTDNMVMEAEKFSDILLKYRDERKVIIRNVIQLTPDRIHTIITGMVILQTIMVKYRCSQISVSPYGVREGYLLQMVTGDSTCC